MSNDDREQPRWGERAPDDGNPPRYGERLPTPPPAEPNESSAPAPNSTPQWPTAEPQWGNPAPSWSAPHTPPAAGNTTPRRRTLGIVAALAALAALILAVIGGLLLGHGLTAIPGIGNLATQGSGTAEQDIIKRVTDDPSLAVPFATAGILGLAGTALGIWAIVQGLIAAIKRRGRAYGFTAVIVAIIAPLVFIIVYISIAASAIG